MQVTPEMIAAAWRAFRRDNMGRLGPGPGFVEAIQAALNAMPQGARNPNQPKEPEA